MRMAEKTFELVFLNTARAAESVRLQPGEFFIGRSRTNAIVLEDPLASRKHLRIETAGDKVTAEDMDSSHGTFLNDKRVRGKISLNNGDVLQIGDAKLRFAVSGNPEAEECTSFIDAPEPTPALSNATDCAQVPGGGETRFMAPHKALPEDDIDKTRIIDAGETRLMDASEFKGLKAAPGTALPRRKLIPLFALVIMLVIVAAVWLFTRDDGSDGISGTDITQVNDQYSLAISTPGNWKLTQGNSGALFGFQLPVRGSDTPARMDVYAERNQDYALTGLQMAFESYKDVIAARHPGLRISGSIVMLVKNATVIFYSFSSPLCSGKGLFLISGTKRICAECTCPPAAFSDHLSKVVFPSLLRTFRLTEPQQFIDFPPPTEAIRRLALANKEHLAAMSKRSLDAGNDLLKNRNVRPENLYLAHRTMQTCMTTAAALGERPFFYSEAVARLAEATRDLANGLRDQKFRILVAEHRRDIEQAYWEAVKLAQMMPEKTNDYYQFAAKRITSYAKLREQ